MTYDKPLAQHELINSKFGREEEARYIGIPGIGIRQARYIDV